MTEFEFTGKKKGKGFKMEAWWEERSLAEKILLGIGFALMGLGFFALAGWVVMLLWNWLMPDIFGLPTVSYWQAWGLLVLFWILFKSWSFKDSDHGSDRRCDNHTDRGRSRGDPAALPLREASVLL